MESDQIPSTTRGRQLQVPPPEMGPGVDRTQTTDSTTMDPGQRIAKAQDQIRQQRVEEEAKRKEKADRNARQSRILGVIEEARGYADCEGDLREFSRGWALHWIRVAKIIEEELGWQILDSLALPKGSEYSIARGLLDQARSPSDSQGFGGDLHRAIEFLQGDGKQWALREFLRVIRGHVYETMFLTEESGDTVLVPARELTDHLGGSHRFASDRPPEFTSRQAPPSAITKETKAYISAEEIAAISDVDPDRLRKRLERWRPTHDGQWIEVTDRGPRQPKYLYLHGPVQEVIDDLRMSKRSRDKASGEVSDQRPTTSEPRS